MIVSESLLIQFRRGVSALLLVLMVLLASCNQSSPAPTAGTSPPSTPTVIQPTPTPSPDPTVVPTPTATLIPTPSPLTLTAPVLPLAWQQALQDKLAASPRLDDGRSVSLTEAGSNQLQWQPLASASDPVLAQRFYALVAPFATVRDGISWGEFQDWWQGKGEQDVWLTTADGALLAPLWGEAVARHLTDLSPTAAQLAASHSWTLLPFDQLDPSYKVLQIDGISVLDNHLQPDRYPLALALTIRGPDQQVLSAWLAPVLQPASNRDATRLTQLIMTGVTAMSRGTAAKMEEKGYVYPALVISDTLAAADITHVSNEAPFIDGCKVNNTYMNLVLCSDLPYWQALEAIGTDIVGLSGNHVNDFGRKGARESLQFYKNHGIPIYGSGLNEEEACAPLLWEDHGNTFAFIAALAWWPETAWATADQPGACNYYDNIDTIMDSIHELSQQVDIVAVELQFAETYHPWPTRDQVQEFRALRQAGADIVTGVQSHVPQAMEPYAAAEPLGAGVIVYGLGNLFFDQMQDWETRTALIARHTIDDGRLISTEILTTVLEDFAQPRWATAKERAGILRSIFAAAPAKDELPPPEPTATPVPPVATGPAAPELTPSPALATPTPIPQPGPAWPSPVSEPSDHYWLMRPVLPPANAFAAPSYAFGNTQNGRYRVHHGADIANPAGTLLLAPASALISHAGLDQPPHVLGAYPDFFGNAILFQLDRDWQGRPLYVLYGHMRSVSVNSGQHVEAGQTVGQVGMSGIAIGPHVHVEVRLDESDYEHSYNAELWMTPLPGRGTLAGQVVTPDGRAWPDINLLVYRLEAEDRRLVQVVTTYADDPGLHADPVWAENFVMANVPAGQYQVVLRLRQQTFTQDVTVQEGQTSYARFVVAP